MPEYVERKLCEAHHKALMCIIDLQVKAINAHLEATDKRVGMLNELRKDVLTDREQFVNKVAHDIKEAVIDKQVSELRDRVTVLETRIVTWISAVGAVLVLVEIALRLIKF